MKRLVIAAVGLALVAGITTGCGCSGYSKAEVEATVAASLTASAEQVRPTPTPSPLLTGDLVIQAVRQYVEDNICADRATALTGAWNDRAWTICQTEYGFASGAPGCDAVYRPEHDTWQVVCHSGTFEGYNFGGETNYYLVDDRTGRVSKITQ
jgi:hypothetical protein